MMPRALLNLAGGAVAVHVPLSSGRSNPSQLVEYSSRLPDHVNQETRESGYSDFSEPQYPQNRQDHKHKTCCNRRTVRHPSHLQHNEVAVLFGRSGIRYGSDAVPPDLAAGSALSEALLIGLSTKRGP